MSVALMSDVTRRAVLAAALSAFATMPAFAGPQTGSGGSASSSSRPTVSAKSKCVNCKASRDTLRAQREKLLMKIDSLRWEFDHNRMNQAERARLSEEMTRTVMALQESLEQSMSVNVVVASEADAYREATRASPASIVTVQSGFRRARGYIGVTFDGAMIELPRGIERVVRFYQYPRIALVEPSSPAERAGILEGDTLLALNGDDVKETEISFTKLLVPDSRVVLRVRREGNAKEVKVVVGVAPEYYAMRAPVAGRPPMEPGAPMEPREIRLRAPMAQNPDVPMVPMPPMPGSMWIVSDGVAGAKVETLSEGLGKAFGAKTGILVLKASPATPAYRSGLRDGDVILRASGESVSTVRELRAVLQNADQENGVKLVILRDKKQKDLTLRW